MHTENPEFTKPDGNPKLWRFMGFTKFVNMLSSETLYFCRSDLLGDPFEGMPTKATLEERKNALEKFLLGEKLNKIRKEVKKNDHIMNQFWIKTNFVNSWHKNDYEPYNMWATYAPNEGIAIQSSWKRLVDSISESIEEIHIGMVDYLDHRLDNNGGNAYRKLLTKRKNFSSENELRAIISSIPRWHYTDGSNIVSIDKTLEDSPTGLSIKIKLDDLIEKIIIAPKSPSWFKSTVESICKKYDVQKPVENSELDDIPE